MAILHINMARTNDASMQAQRCKPASCVRECVSLGSWNWLQNPIFRQLSSKIV